MTEIRENMSPSPTRPRDRGVALVYTCAVMLGLVAFVSIGVDLGRAQNAKTELQTAADAAARYATGGVLDSSYFAKAAASALENKVDGTPLVLTAADVEIGSWNSTTKVFTLGGSTPDAIRVTAHRMNSRSTGLPMIFGSIIGRRTVDLSARSVAQIIQGATITATAYGKGNPWLAGMPNGTTANGYDVAPAESPALISGAALTPGSSVKFDFSGSASNGPGINPSFGDGQIGSNISNNSGNEHGIANVTMPLCAVVAVFLDNTQPDTSPAPASLDFSTTASRDFTTLSPLLKQPFFIGDGMRDDGVTPQSFVVPAGATRLYIGIMDGYEWSNNSGSFSSNTTRPPTIKTVK